MITNMSLGDINARVETYVRGKSWYWYAPLWLLGLYACWQLFRFNMVAGRTPLIVLIPYSFDFFLHEWAHIFTAFLPAVLTAAAGSLSELLLGAGLVIAAIWQRSYFALLFCLLWFDLACQSAGQYMADAVPQRLPLVSLAGALSGQEPKHDWHFVFGQLHLLGASAFISGSLRVIGGAAGILGLAFAAWLLYKMARAPAWAASGNEAILVASYRPTASPKPALPEDNGFTSYPIGDSAPVPTPSKHTRHI